MHDKKVALVTGANKGIGLEIGRQLAGRGFTVALAGRDRARVDEAADGLRAEGLDVHGIVLDVTDEATAEAAARTLDERFGRLDVLVNNAGVAADLDAQGRPSGTTVAALRSVYETNVFGVLAATRALLPLLRRSAPRRISNQSSTLGSLASLSDPAHPFAGVNLLAYNSSKTALNALTVSLAKDLAADRIVVNATCPGWVHTDMGGAAPPRSVEQGAAIAVKLATMDDPPTGKYLDDSGEIPW